MKKTTDKQNQKKLKLKLRTETLRVLDDKQLTQINGGANTTSYNCTSFFTC